MPAAARRKQRAQRLKLLGQFVREHSWGVMITVLIVIALVLFVCVIGRGFAQTGGRGRRRRRTPRRGMNRLYLRHHDAGCVLRRGSEPDRHSRARDADHVFHGQIGRAGRGAVLPDLLHDARLRVCVGGKSDAGPGRGDRGKGRLRAHAAESAAGEGLHRARRAGREGNAAAGAGL